MDLTEEEILEGLSSETQIIDVRRLKRRNTITGQREPCEAIRVCFKGSSLPSYIHMFDTRVNVNPYVYPVTQCSRCWRFGHSLKMCPSSRVVCPKCGRDHPNCETLTYKCNNCSGNHMALARICPVYKKEKRIRELMAEFNCSYKRALSIYIPPEPHTPKESPKTLNHPSADMYDNNMDKSTTQTTYADIVKTNNEPSTPKTTKKKTKNRKSNQQKNKTQDSDWFELTSESEELSKQPRQVQTGENFKNKKSWKELLKIMKDKLLDREMTWQEKVKDCINIIMDWIISSVCAYASNFPCFDVISSWLKTS
ncbi:uncharacterized protein LOC114361200 [Ostrinia furnacalis]|uniref:uncharacterized protein LOC114361200 n=1 Tax=Ostrinia furnacalis TaxID=93504 RepID=UPI001039164D|nr:uncharacterized protein LOC114361200 [Ostrinia furnacalis]